MSRITITATVAVCAIGVVAAWQVFQPLLMRATSTTAASNPHTDGAQNIITNADSTWKNDIAGFGQHQPLATSSSPEQIAALGQNVVGQLLVNVAALRQAGQFSTDTVASMINNVASSTKPTVAHRVYTIMDISTTSNTTYTRALAYRSDLQHTLRPLLKNKTMELELYAQYTETKDSSYLDALRAAAANYHAAADATVHVAAPLDAVPYQLGILNAMEEFAATIEAMAANANDPLASIALLRSYNQAEGDMYSAFDALASYYKLKQATQ